MSIEAINPATASAPGWPAVSQDSSAAAQSWQAKAYAADNDSPDPLMTALQQTLSQLAGANSGDPVVRHVVADANISLAAIPRSNNPAVGDIATTGAQLIDALYRALAMQESAAAASGAGTGSREPGSDASTVAGVTATSGSGTSTYTDLASRIANLADESRQVLGEDGAGWDHFPDASPASQYAGATVSADPMSTALTKLDDALRSHLAAREEDGASSASLPDVLDALAGNTVGMSWQPVGVVVDLTA